MNLIKNFFTRQKGAFDEEETTWRRDKINPDEPYYPPSPKNQTNENNNRLNLVRNSRNNDGLDDYYFTEEEAPAKLGAINTPSWMAANPKSKSSEPQSKYVDYSMPVNQNLKTTPRSNFNMVSYGMEVSTSQDFKYDDGKANLLNPPNFNQPFTSFKQYVTEPMKTSELSNQEQGFRLDQQFKRNHRGNSITRRRDRMENPRLKEYYELETRINRQMMLVNQDASPSRQPVIRQLDIFNSQPTYTENFGVSPSPTRLQQNPQSPKAYSQPRTEIFGEVKAQPNLTKRRMKIFEGQAQTIEAVHVRQSTTPSRSITRTNRQPQDKPNWLAKLDIGQNSLYDGKDLDELMQIHKTRSVELRQLEAQLAAANADARNIAPLEHALSELNSKIDNLTKKTSFADGEKRVLLEDINKKQLELHREDHKPDFISSMPTSEINAKENTIKEIDKVQEKLTKVKEQMNNFAKLAVEKQQKWKELSEKNMYYEMEAMKMNLNNYDEELIRELKYFLGKYS
jgi:hypothetical protein